MTQRSSAPDPAPGPPRDRTGLWIALVCGSLLVVALGVTGFVRPGFFLTDAAPGVTPDGPAPAPEPDSTTVSSTAGTAAPGAQAIVDAFVARLNAKDAAGAAALVCEGLESTTKGGIATAVAGAPGLKADKVRADGSGAAQLSGTLSGKQAAGYVVATTIAGKWCVGGMFVFAA